MNLLKAYYFKYPKMFLYFFILIYQLQMNRLVETTADCQYYPNYPSTTYKFSITCAEKCCDTQYPLTSNDACCSYNNFKWYYVVLPLLGIFLISIVVFVVWFFCIKKQSKIFTEKTSISPALTSQAELMGSRQVTNISIFNKSATSFTDSRTPSTQPQSNSRTSGISKKSRVATANINFIDYELMFERPPVYETFDEFKAKSAKNKNTVSFYENPIIVPIDVDRSVPNLKEYEESSPDPLITDTPSTLNVVTPVDNFNTPDLYGFSRENNTSSLDYDFPFPIQTSTPNYQNNKDC